MNSATRLSASHPAIATSRSARRRSSVIRSATGLLRGSGFGRLEDRVEDELERLFVRTDDRDAVDENGRRRSNVQRLSVSLILIDPLHARFVFDAGVEECRIEPIGRGEV